MRLLDLIAVLCPFGPLRLLLESSKKQQREVPALLYTVNAVWFMMASADQLRQLEPTSSKQINQRRSASSSYSPSNFIRKSHDGFMRLPDHDLPTQMDSLPANPDPIVTTDPKPEAEKAKNSTHDDDQGKLWYRVE